MPTAADELEVFYVHTITVEPYEGEGSYGPIHGAPDTLTPDTGTGVLVDETSRMVRDADSREVVSSTTVFARPSQASQLAAGTRVTLPSGAVTTVLSRAVRTMPGLDMPEHVEANLE